VTLQASGELKHKD